ncbi:signal peptidase I [bacterium]|nr:signal peptidase I [bacterium]
MLNNPQLKQKFKAALKETVETAVFVVVMVIIIKFFFGEIRWIPSGSMHPTLVEQDRIIVERVSRFYREPQRGDILVFYPPMVKLEATPLKVFERLTGFFCSDIAFIKRVVGLPGDKVEIKKSKEDGAFTVFINDKPLDEPYIKSKYDYNDCTQAMHCGPMIVPEGEYFMMGDNRGNSQDSRYWGFLPKERIIGRAITLIWPLTRIKNL